MTTPIFIVYISYLLTNYREHMFTFLFIVFTSLCKRFLSAGHAPNGIRQWINIIPPLVRRLWLLNTITFFEMLSLRSIWRSNLAWYGLELFVRVLRLRWIQSSNGRVIWMMRAGFVYTCWEVHHIMKSHTRNKQTVDNNLNTYLNKSRSVE